MIGVTFFTAPVFAVISLLVCPGFGDPSLRHEERQVSEVNRLNARDVITGGRLSARQSQAPRQYEIVYAACSNVPSDQADSCTFFLDTAITSTNEEYCGTQFSQLQRCLAQGNPDVEFCRQRAIDYNECGTDVLMIYESCVNAGFSVPNIGPCANRNLGLQPEGTICLEDAELLALERSSSAAIPFCTSFLASPTGVAFPTFLSQFTATASFTSACSCFQNRVVAGEATETGTATATGSTPGGGGTTATLTGGSGVSGSTTSTGLSSGSTAVNTAIATPSGGNTTTLATGGTATGGIVAGTAAGTTTATGSDSDLMTVTSTGTVTLPYSSPSTQNTYTTVRSVTTVVDGETVVTAEPSVCIRRKRVRLV